MIKRQISKVTTISHKGVDMIFNTPNMLCLWRAESLFKKEPMTVKWLDTFTNNSILWDVGANVGMYSIYSAAIKKCKVYSFEPESLNFSILNQNIMSNKLDDYIQAYCIAISNEFSLGKLRLSTFKAGASIHTVGKKDFSEEYVFNQGSLTVSLNWLLEQTSIPIPTHLKIDVDGIEDLIIDGSQKLLSNPTLKEILIEIDTNNVNHIKTTEKIKSFGFELIGKDVNQHGRFRGFAEYIFRRN